ncbi:MAG: 2-oxoglutarate dehydrogenase complex dihydrolipoyllysine-residue succinyltransferase [Caldilineaceae bacterium]
MSTNIVVPELGESVIEATVAQWLKHEGDRVAVGDTVLELDTDKVTLEVAATQDGVLGPIQRQPGEPVKAGDVLGTIENGIAAAAQAPAAREPAKEISSAPQPAAEEQPEPPRERERVTPVARRMAQEHAVDLGEVKPGDGGRVTKGDVQRYLEHGATAPEAPATAPVPAPAPATKPAPQGAPPAAPAPMPSDGREERKRMSLRRQTIARRLLEAQSTAAMLTTFNEVDMHAVMALRARRKESFKAKYGVSLGLSSFFVKAAVGALKAFPELNAEIQGAEIVLKHYYDIGIAVGAAEGLVVPVLRDAERMSFAQIERAVRDYAAQAEAGKLSIEALRGGTFTITNGGVFGSLLSTPILNPPQVGILGLHAIKDRPVVVDGEIRVRPMMYVALTYDHRIVDGREAVQFLVRIKELVEDPESLLLEG